MRLHGLDLLRLGSLAAVVAIHCFYTNAQLAKVSAYCGFAVPCFVLLAMYFAARRLDGGDKRLRLLRQRLLRLAPAFLAWSAAYLVARWAGGALRPSWRGLLGAVFLGSAAVHLYFVPLIIVFSAVQCCLPARGAARTAACLVGAAGAVYLQVLGLPSLELGSPEANAVPGYVVFNLPYLFLGALAFDLLHKPAARRLRVPVKAAWAGLCAVGAVVCWIVPASSALGDSLLTIARHSLLFAAFLFAPVRLPASVVALAGVSFGAYLGHHLFLEALERVGTWAHLDPATGWVTLARWALALIASIVLCLILRQWKRTAWLVK